MGVLVPIVTGWRRPKTGERFVCGNGMSPDDCKQGKIGDCYLISSLSVLGEQNLKKAIGYDSDDKLLWQNGKGAYMVKFFKFSR